VDQWVRTAKPPTAQHPIKQSGNIAFVVQVTPNDVKPMVDRMIVLLRQPHQRSRRRRVADWFQGSSERDAEWRADALAFFVICAGGSMIQQRVSPTRHTT
jgi:hypothetical protein